MPSVKVGNQRFNVAHAHEEVTEVAKALAHELYDAVMRDDILYKEWKRQHPGFNSKHLEMAFVKKQYSKCIPAARATLALMLTGSYDEAFKAKVHEALVLDKSLILGRNRPLGALKGLK
jgi:hypothetical protein